MGVFATTYGAALAAAKSFMQRVGLTTSAGAVNYASQAEAEAGTVDDKLMSPLRTKQSIDANASDTLGDITPTKGSIAAGNGFAWIAKAAETDGFLLKYDSTMPSGIGTDNPANFQDADDTLDSLVDLAATTPNGRLLAMSSGGDVETFPDPSSGDILAQSGASPTGYAWQSPADAGVQATSQKGQANGYAGLDGSGRVPLSQLPTSVKTLLGEWNAATNTPTLADGTGDQGDTYIVGTAGTQDLGSGSQDFDVGDEVIYLNGDWTRNGRNDLVTSVAGKQGVVTLDADDITDATTLGKALIRAANAAAARSSLSAQEQNAALDDIAGLSLAQGDILTVNASGNVTRLAKGATGQVLTQFGNNPVWATPAKNVLVAPCFSAREDCATGDGAFVIALPITLSASRITRVAANCMTAGVASASEKMEIQVRTFYDGFGSPVDILSTKVKVAGGSINDDGAAVIDTSGSTNRVTGGQLIAIDVDQIHTGTAAKGLVVTLELTAD